MAYEIYFINPPREALERGSERADGMALHGMDMNGGEKEIMQSLDTTTPSPVLAEMHLGCSVV